MDLTTAEGIDAWIIERSREKLRLFEEGFIPFSAYAYNIGRIIEYGRIMHTRLNTVMRDEPVRPYLRIV